MTTQEHLDELERIHIYLLEHHLDIEATKVREVMDRIGRLDL